MYYHAWFKTKQRKWLLQGEVEQAVKQILADVASQHDLRMIACETMVDHVHVLVEVADRMELSKAMHLLKGTSSRRLMESIPEIKLDAGISHFWQKRYGSKPVEASALPTVREYIRTQKERPEKYAR